MVAINIVLVVISCVVLQLSTASTITPIWLSPLKTTTTGAALQVPRGEWMNSTVGVGSRSSNFVVQVDSKGKIWILGGNSKFATNAVWNYDPKTDLYRWVAGKVDSSDKLSPNYTAFGVPDAGAFPGSGAITIGAYSIDHNDNIWMYGGANNQNMFWRFNTSSFEFTNFRANDTYLPVFDEVGVPSADNYPGILVGGSLIVDSHNNLWLLGGYRYYSINKVWYTSYVNEVWHFNTTSLGTTGSLAVPDDYDINNYPAARSGAGMVDRQDGTLLVGGGAAVTADLNNDYWLFNKTSKLWKFVYGNLNHTSSQLVANEFIHYRSPGSVLGERWNSGVSGGIHNRGNFILCGGDDDTNYFSDIWIFPQDQCVGANNDCDVNAVCTVSSDDNFSRTCTCNEGYIDDGKTCTLPTPPSASSPSNVTPNNNGTPSKSPSSKVSGAGAMITCSLLIFLATFVLPFL